LASEAVPGRERDHEALPIQRLDVEALLERLRLGHDREIELADAQQFAKLLWHALRAA
jgi:hypothetical protein